MRRLRELCLIQTKQGASGEFHYVLLINPNAAMEWMRNAELVQDALYARFIDRLIEVGAFAEIEAFREHCKLIQEAEAEALAKKTEVETEENSP
jgi:hypothetical protein